MTQDSDQQLFHTAEKFFEAGDYSQAFPLVEELVETDSSSADVYFMYGHMLHLRGKLGAAIKAFRKAVEIDPEHTEAAVSLSVVYNDIGRYDEGRTVFQMARHSLRGKHEGQDARIDRRFADKHVELADLYLHYNRFDEALFEYNKASSLNPSQLSIRIKMAKVLAKKGYVSRAMQELRKLKVEHPDFLEARINLGLLLFSQNQIIDAQQEWEAVLFKDARNQEAQTYLKMASQAKETNV